MKGKSMEISSFLCVLLILGIFGVAAAGGHGKSKPTKKGILLVAFGTSIPEAQVAFDNIDRKAKEAFPGIPVRWAFTSRIIRKKLAKEGKQLDSVATALARMMDDDFTHVAVQSLHTIGGEEFHDLVRTAHGFRDMRGGLERVLVGYPLLATEEDMARVAEIMIRHIPEERKKHEGVVLMGHGTHHPSNAFYPALTMHLQQKDPYVFLGTVEGAPTIEDIKALLLAKEVKKAYLMPFMSVAGDHARNDLAGDEEDSWKTILTQAGIECVPVLKGTAEYDDMVDVWIDHLKMAMSHFS
jgi:sirohydrochlorin cobaltochelatase